MTPKEKAEQIYKQMLGDDGSTHPKVFGGVKRCALIAVDELILEQCKSSELKNPKYQNDRIIYWQQVKQEIKNM